MKLPVILHSTDGKERPVEIERIEEPQSVRLLRGGKVLAFCWVAAFVSIFIPALHFFLVPAFFVAGPVAFFYRYRQRTHLLNSALPCLQCGTTFSLDTRNEQWPLECSCPKCGRHMWMDKASA